jgi:hypothetical protein
LWPLYGGYPDVFWIDSGATWAREMRRHFFFTPIRDDHAIGADLRATVTTGQASDVTRYPYATCELGGGMAIAYHRRPLVRLDDVAALALTKLGSGSVWQGYYLYHGCSQRTDLAQPNQESHATGYPNDMPVVNYDFQAPIGEYGQVWPSWHALRLQHLFIKDSGANLAGMPMHLPAQPPAARAVARPPRRPVHHGCREGRYPGRRSSQSWRPVRTQREVRKVPRRSARQPQAGHGDVATVPWRAPNSGEGTTGQRVGGGLGSVAAPAGRLRATFTWREANASVPRS